MPPLALFGVTATALSTALLLIAEQRRSWTGRALTKPVAAAGFLVAAVGFGALHTPHGQWILAGLVLSALGDVALIGSSRGAFLAGLGSFLLGHVAFAVAFTVRGVDALPSVIGLALAALLGAVAWRWLSPHVDREMRIPVLAYLAVISAMVALAVGTVAHAPSATLVAGAIAFAVSDLSVARDRFITKGVVNKLWGLPLYFGAQLLIASSAG